MSVYHSAKSWIGRGLIASRLFRRSLGDGGVVVAFHRVNDDIPEDGLTRSSRSFEAFCRRFSSSFDVITLTDFVSRLERKASVAGALAITFDDGYLDNFTVAAPILKQLNLPATFYITTGFIGSTIVPWWDAAISPRQPWMDWDHVRQLAAEGFEIGAHTRSHADLGKVEGDEAKKEIAGSREELREAIGRVPEHFAYPYGQKTNLLEGNRALVKCAGFRSCVSCFGGRAVSTTDPHRLRRVPISPWFRTPEQFLFEVAWQIE